MELLDRYLQAVRKPLPWQRQDDIIAELRANLEAQLEEKEEALGRALTPAEAEEWIKSLGSPVQMAAHYQPQQYLIGPAIYPVYTHILRLASMWAIVIYIVVNTITIVLSSTATGQTVADAAFRLPWVLIQERPVERGKKRRTYAHAVAEIVFGFIFLGWLLVVPKHPFLMFGPGAAVLHASPFRPAPVLWTFYWLLLCLSAIELAWSCINLLRDAWQTPNRYRHIVMKFLGLVPMVFMATAPHGVYVLLRNPGIDADRYGRTLDSINQGAHTVVLLMCAIVSLQFVWEIAKLVYESMRDRAVAR